jgi:hypothetical protein
MAYQIIIDGFSSYEVVDEIMQWLISSISPETHERTLKYMVGNTVIFTSYALEYEHTDKAVYRALNNHFNRELMKEEYGALDYGWSVIKEYKGKGWYRYEVGDTNQDLEPLFTAFTIDDFAVAVQLKLLFTEHIYSIKQDA